MNMIKSLSKFLFANWCTSDLS